MLPMKEKYPVNKSLNKMESEALKKQVTNSEATHAAASKSASEVMIIEPSTRANDFKEAYQYLRSQKTGSRISFQLSSGPKLSNVVDLDIMKGGSLVIFKMTTTKGLQYKVVRIEDIVSIEHS